MKMTVIGTGYLGAVHAACMAELGHDVLGVDVDPAKISALAEGRAPFYEPGLAELLERNTGNGRLTFSTSLAEAAAHGDIHFICVGTSGLELFAAFERAAGRALPVGLTGRRPGGVAQLVAHPGLVAREWGWRTPRDVAAMGHDPWRLQQRHPFGHS